MLAYIMPEMLRVFALIVGGITAVFFAVFAFKIAYLDRRLQETRPGGFEVKLNTGMLPVDSRKENDHG